ncbi:MAG: phytoene/squalene synthase family protein [Aquamicrobium sp.]|nr:phytoene/squalene synthase family protein [Aquamicrobium sp.]
MAGEGTQAGLEALRHEDPDRYLSTLYAPAETRAALSVLYGFNAEIAGIRDRIHEPLPGEIRIQWWRDALAGGTQATAGHPLASALSDVIARHRLPLDAFDRYLEARIFDLYDDPMPSRTDLEGYCGETASAMIQLAGLVLAPEAATAFASAAGHAGCAQGIAGLLRLLPLHRSRGQCYVPADILAAAGTSRDDVLAGNDREGTERAIAAMAALGREHALRFEAAAAGMPAELRPAFLPAALAPVYLDRVAALGFEAAKRPADISALRRNWTLLRRATRGWG